MCTRYYIEKADPELKNILQAVLLSPFYRKFSDKFGKAIPLPKGHIDEWICPASDPNSLLQYALTDMVLERADTTDDNDQLTIPFYSDRIDADTLSLSPTITKSKKLFQVT